MSSAAKRWDWTSAYPAPAKLNLFLHVVGRRADGYHLLQTAFRFVDHGDMLSFTPRDDGAVVLARPLPGVAPEDDLVHRAASLLRARSGETRGVTITLEKRLPLGGGLGGGSSDAATVLLALNHLWQLGLDRACLQEIGLQLGADVPVFIFGANAFAEGVGEALRPIDLPPAWYLVLEPPVHIATADIFRSPRLRRDTPPIPPGAWHPATMRSNDLTPVALATAPVLGEYLAFLERFGDARMSGSGACVFAEFASREAALAAAAQCPLHMRGWVAQGLPQHPLRALARD